MKQYFLKYKKEDIFIFFLILLSNIIFSFTSLIHMYALDDLIKGDLLVFVYWYIGAIGLWVVFLLLNHYLNMAQEKMTQKMITDIRCDILHSVSKIDYEKYHKNSTGTYISWLNNDMNTISQSGFKNIYALTSSICLTITSLLALLSLNIWIIFGTLVLTFLIVYTPKLFNTRLTRAMKMITEKNAVFIEKLEDTFKGYDTLFFSNKLNYLVSRINQSSQTIAKDNIAFTKENSIVNNSITMVSVLAQIAIFLLTGTLAYLGKVSIGAVFSTGNLAGNVFAALSQALNYKVAINSVEIIFTKYEDYNQLVSPEDRQKTTLKKPTDLAIRVNNVSYSTNDKNILNNVNFTFKPKNKYLLVGDSGSGKSTVLKLISGGIKGFQGNITINDVDIADVTIQEYIHYVPQESYLFKDSYRNNLTLGSEISNDHLNNILADFGLGHINIDDHFDDKNSGLSGGQKQRINLDRGILSGDKILLLDEVTSSLDKDSVHKIEKTIMNYDNTIIFVTHNVTDFMKDNVDYKYSLTPLT